MTEQRQSYIHMFTLFMCDITSIHTALHNLQTTQRNSLLGTDEKLPSSITRMAVDTYLERQWICLFLSCHVLSTN